MKSSEGLNLKGFRVLDSLITVVDSSLTEEDSVLEDDKDSSDDDSLE